MFVAREERLLLAGERVEAERDAQVAANREYEDYRANGRDTQGRRLGVRAVSDVLDRPRSQEMTWHGQA